MYIYGQALQLVLFDVHCRLSETYCELDTFYDAVYVRNSSVVIEI